MSRDILIFYIGLWAVGQRCAIYFSAHAFCCFPGEPGKHGPIFSQAHFLPTCTCRPLGWFCIARARHWRKFSLCSTGSLPGLFSLERRSQVMIDSYNSALCSGSRFWFQWITARAVSINGFNASLRIARELCNALISSSRCFSYDVSTRCAEKRLFDKDSHHNLS